MNNRKEHIESNDVLQSGSRFGSRGRAVLVLPSLQNKKATLFLFLILEALKPLLSRS